VYVNQFFTDRPGANGTKHIYAGTTRIASKLMRQNTPGANPNGNTPFEKDLFFYHPDHIGSTNFVTDLNGKLYEHLEYFPFGEGWIEENTNQQRTPYLFSAKELDEETGLYYFKARYYDPRTSIWQSADPILGRYLPDAPHKEDEVVKLLSPTVEQPLARFNLPGMGGVFNAINLALYTYAAQNPVRYVDPDGRENKEELKLSPIFDVKPDVANRTLKLESFGAKLSWGRRQTETVRETSPSRTDPVATGQPNVPTTTPQPKMPSNTELAKEVWKLIKGESQTPVPSAPGQPQTRTIERSFVGVEVTAQAHSGLQMTVPQMQISGPAVSGWEVKAQLTVRW
jgi:RHS repeat-associated protein